MATEGPLHEKKKSILALEASNFFLADVQTGLGPFLAAYLAASGWNPGRVGFALTIGGIVTVVWPASPRTQAQAEFAGEKFAMSRIDGSNVFQGSTTNHLEEGVYELIVTAFGEEEETAHDKIQVRVGDGEQSRPRPPHDIENVLDARPNHGLFGTRLGPNRNGRKW